MDHELLLRLDAAESRLSALAETSVDGLTDPDPPTGERWEAGQVWAHLAEFVPYWTREIELVLAGADSARPVPFGRIKTDERRISAIEEGRGEPARDQMQRVSSGLERLRLLLRELGDAGWNARGVHQTRGVMSIGGIVDEFLVKHLEEHAGQLERLAHR